MYVSILYLVAWVALSKAFPLSKRSTDDVANESPVTQSFTLEDAKTVCDCLVAQKYSADAIAKYIHTYIQILETQAGMKGQDGQLIDEFVKIAAQVQGQQKNLIHHILETLVSDYGASYLTTLYNEGRKTVKKVTNNDPSFMDCFDKVLTQKESTRILELLKKIFE